MEEDEIVLGGLYRGKRPAYDFFGGIQNDRAVIFIDRVTGTVQYDSYTVKNGRHYPATTIEKFAKWAKLRINDDGSPYTEPMS